MFKQGNDSCLKKDMSQCTFCQHLSSKAVLYVCESGHILCGSCHANSSHSMRLDDGDCLKCRRKKSHKGKRQPFKSRSYEADFASGDFTENKIKPEIVNKNDKSYLKQDQKGGDNIIVTYKNEHYQDDKSDTSAGSNENSPEKVKVGLQECKPVSRPVTCPVCAKMIAIDSVLQHFFFDHSKVSRYTLKLQSSQHIILKISDFGEGTNCLSVVLLENGKCTNNSPLLLMSAYNKNDVIDKDSRTFSNNQIKTSNKSCSSVISKDMKKSNEKLSENANNEIVKDNCDLLFWLCKTVDAEVIYSLTISKEDKKMSFSYTGDAMHIRDDQNGLNMFNKAECVIVKRVAARKLINNDGFIHVFVTILHVCNLLKYLK